MFPGLTEPGLPLSDPFSQASGCRRMNQAILSPRNLLISTLESF